MGIGCVLVNRRDTRMNRYIVAIAVAAGCFSLATGQGYAQSAEAGQAVFKHDCAICHDVTPGKNKIGPSMSGVVGRSAGTVPNFHYSDANKGSALTWDVATLDRYLVNPRATVANTTMSYAGVKDERKRRDLIAYLSTLK
jgi:cytochrome c2